MVDDEMFDELEEAEKDLRRMQEEEVESARAGYSNGRYLLRAHHFHVAAQYVAMYLCGVPAVQRIVLFGSVSMPSNTRCCASRYCWRR